jgi:hypothetical protein
VGYLDERGFRPKATLLRLETMTGISNMFLASLLQQQAKLQQNGSEIIPCLWAPVSLLVTVSLGMYNGNQNLQEIKRQRK